jgi:hypothetical protein
MPIDNCTLERLKCAAEMRRAAEEPEEQTVERQPSTTERRRAITDAPPGKQAPSLGEASPAAPRRNEPAPPAQTLSVRPEQTGMAPGQPESTEPPQKTASRFVDILHRQGFRLLWTGEFASLVGGQLFVVALPWLVLLLTHNSLAIGTVLAVSTAPRTVLILIGGGLIDRFSPRTVMLYSNISRMSLSILLTVLTLTGLIHLWMLYVISLLLGIGFAFYLPAQSVMIPRLVREDELAAGNAIIQGTAQLSLFLGPILAGVLIAFVGGQAGAVKSAGGISLVFAINSLGLAVSAVTLWLIRLPAKTAAGSPGSPAKMGLLRSVAQGLSDVWADRALRLYFILIGVTNIALLGPISVGIPLLVHDRFPGGALAYGAILSGLGAGALVGVVAGGVLPSPPGRFFTVAMLGSVALLGTGLIILGAISQLATAVAGAFLIGLAEGYLTVEFITWLQVRATKQELGRMISILLFASVGMAPISNLIAGALINASLTWVMAGAGIVVILVAVLAASRPAIWEMSGSKVDRG